MNTDLNAIWQAAAAPGLLTARRDGLGCGCWIYGAGGYGLRVQAALQMQGVDVLGFVDRRAGSAVFAQTLGWPVVHPDAFDDRQAEGRSLVIGVMNPLSNLSDPQAWASKFPFAQIVLPGMLPDLLGPGLDCYWMTRRNVTADNIDRIMGVHERLADEASRTILNSLVRFRLTADPQDHPSVDIDGQYFPGGVPLDIRDVRLVDGGAFTGDTFQNLTRLGLGLSEWYAFEPDLENFRRLSAVAQQASTKTALFPCGLASKSADLFFTDGQGASSHLDLQPTATKVRVLALDDVLFGVSPSYIKLDIEGFEAEALRGAQKTIASCRPSLAVCIYHKPEDLWMLPELVLDLCPESDLYIRQHGHNGFDTVLYAINRA